MALLDWEGCGIDLWKGSFPSLFSFEASKEAWLDDVWVIEGRTLQDDVQVGSSSLIESGCALMNGNAKGWVKASRGLRQGDPLSPFLFTIVADVLSRMMLRAEERSLLEGFRVEELQTLKSLLLVFRQISGLKVNLDKSNLFGINLDQNHLSRLALLLDCKASDWPILYPGLPLGGNSIACRFWDPVIERISRRLDGWQKAYLSFGGRITLIHSCLSHIPSYFLSLFKIPNSVVAKIERLQRDFLWSGVGEGKRDYLVSWDIVCKSRVKGGLGFGKISLRNLALLGKWLWRYPRKSTTLWHQVILSIYGTHTNGWDANILVRWSHRCPWKAIAQVFQDFFKHTRFVVGDGERIRFWEDLWWGDQPLKSQYPRLFRVVTDKNSPIFSILGSARPFSWNFNFRHNLSDSEIEDLECLMQSLDCMHLSTSASNARSWSLSSPGLFTVKSFFIALSQVLDLSPCFPTKFVCNSQVPFKVKSFVWLVAHKKVNTNDLIQLRRPYKAFSPDICKLCMKQGESADHLFLHCSLSMGLWHRLFQLAKMDWVPLRSISDMMFINYKGNLLVTVFHSGHLPQTPKLSGRSNRRQKLKQHLFTHFQTKDLGKLKYFLGIEIAQFSSGVVLSQRKYALDILEEIDMLDCKPIDTPMDPNVKLVPGQGEPLGDPGRYRRLVGKLNYLTITRPDISFPMSVVSQFLQSPCDSHWDAVIRILRYIKSTPDQGVLYENRGHTQVVGYTNADWAGSPTDRRSTSGCCVFIGGNLISWKSKKQDIVARSSAETEYRAMTLATCELIWLRHLLRELRFGKDEQMKLICDN
ncbi:putative mitochondrial protein [Vitis vinifera]|uniref:Putative mitochondrial protein n=1 Tax=Vitis vinifera TaxID=29760 RepID=A0A438J7T3_VITVI|nr:putative mitochondrial protein [Vitis vinifera]